MTYFALVCVLAGQISVYHGGHYGKLEACAQAKRVLVNHRTKQMACWCSIKHK